MVVRSSKLRPRKPAMDASFEHLSNEIPSLRGVTSTESQGFFGLLLQLLKTTVLEPTRGTEGRCKRPQQRSFDESARLLRITLALQPACLTPARYR